MVNPWRWVALRLALAVLALNVGCPSTPPPALDARQLLIRASLDLRGVRPSIADYARLAADESALAPMLDEFLADPRFAERMRALYTPILRTQIDQYPVAADDYGLPDDAAFQAAVGEELPRMVEHIAALDLPFTELVVGDWTMANGLLAMAWPLDASPADPGWQRARYTDGRPAAGMLATNSMWWRYPSAGVNYNRGRANAVSRILLCNDYLSREVVFPRDVDLTDPELVADALRTNEGCVNCHATLDGLASYLFGFQYIANPEAQDAARYHPERERGWVAATGVPPSFYGEPGYGLRDLGLQIAADHRFVQCAVETVFEGLVARDAGLADADALTRHREAFLAGGLTLRALVRSIVEDDAWLGRSSDRDAAVRKVLPPDLLASAVEDLTGYRFTVEGRDMLESDLVGLRSLAGGVDGATGAAPSRVPTPTMVLVHERLAEAASAFVARADAELPPRERRLFLDVDFEDARVSDGPSGRAQIQRLHERLFGRFVPDDSPQVTEGLALLADLSAVGADPVDAWAGVLSVLLRDPDFILY